MRDLDGFAKAMDRCWLERRFGDLEAYLATDVVFVGPDGKVRTEGLPAAVESYREFMEACRVDHYRAHDCSITQRGDAAVIEYRWEMGWSDGNDSHYGRGREILVLSRDAGWRAIWRRQIAL